MKFLFNKQMSIIKKIEKYLSLIETCLNRFNNCMNYLINQKDIQDLEEIVDSVHNAESEADDLKRDIKNQLYQ